MSDRKEADEAKKREREIKRAKKKHKKDKKENKKKRLKPADEEPVVAEAVATPNPVAPAAPVQNVTAAAAPVVPSVEAEAKKRQKLFTQPDKLPEFMRQAHAIGGSSQPQPGFAELGLSSRTVTLLTQQMDFAHPFPVQSGLVPYVLRETRYAGGDALVMSATGSGKTLAFALPIVEIASQSHSKELACLCVLPTKDIALQVYEVFVSLCDGTGVSVALLSGERSFFAEQAALRSDRPQIVVATPGRLRDHLLTSISAESLHRLRWLVIDEGDRLLAEQYHQWLDDLMPHLLHPVDVADGPFARPPLQKLVFSATMTSNPRKLAKLKLYRPVFFHTLDESAATTAANGEAGVVRGAPVLPSSLREFKVVCPSEEERPLVLMWLLESGLVEKRGALVFINSVERAHVLHDVIGSLLEKKQIGVGLYTSRVNAKERADALAQFKQGSLRALIVTDVLARGLDLQQSVAVINYDTPFREEAYIHRVGRTARAGKAGEAYVLGLWTELASWSKMRTTQLQGGNLAAKKLKPLKKALDDMRPSFVDQLDVLKRKKRHTGTNEKDDKKLAVPLEPATVEAAIAVLRKNHTTL